METTTKTLKVSLDFDGVLADTISILLEIIEEKYDKKYQYDQVTNWGIFYNEWGIKKKHLWKLFEECTQRLCDYPVVDENANHIIFLLKREFDIDLVTSNVGTKEDILDKLESMGIRSTYHFDEFVQLEPEDDKATLGYNIYIDDNPNLVEKIGDDQFLFLYDQPWNQHIENRENVVRVYDFMDLMSKIPVAKVFFND